MSTHERPLRRPGQIGAAVRLVLDADAFAGHEDRFAAFHADAHGAEWWDFAAILEDWPWSPGQVIGLHAAHAVYNGGDQVALSDVLIRLDDDLLDRVLRACRIALGWDDAGAVAA